MVTLRSFLMISRWTKTWRSSIWFWRVVGSSTPLVRRSAKERSLSAEIRPMRNSSTTTLRSSNPTTTSNCPTTKPPSSSQIIRSWSKPRRIKLTISPKPSRYAAFTSSVPSCSLFHVPSWISHLIPHFFPDFLICTMDCDLNRRYAKKARSTLADRMCF